MENASKALIMAAEILIGVILLTLMVFLFRAMANFSDTVNSNIATKNINEFNIGFEQYRVKPGLMVQDIISMGNLAKQYNEQMESIPIEVIAYGVEAKYRNVHKLTDELSYEFIRNYSNNLQTNDIIYFECQKMEYDEETGRINRIEVKKIE